MRYIRYISTIIFLLLLIGGGVEVFAMNTGFSTVSLSADDIDTFFKNVKISVLTDEPPKKAIECFSVNEDGLIAIGCSNLENKTVCIYSSDGDFQYGYSFKTTGSFGIELDKSVLNIYFVRSDVAISINPVGEVESILKIQNTSENNSYWNHSVFSTKRKIGDTEYAIKNDMGIFNVLATSYSQLIITNGNGEKSILYDVNSDQLFTTLVVFIMALAFVCLAVFAIIREFIKLNHRT